MCESVVSNSSEKLGHLSSPQNGLQLFRLTFDEPQIMALSGMVMMSIISVSSLFVAVW